VTRLAAILKKTALLAAGTLIALGVAEAVSIWFLPRPVPQLRPFVRVQAVSAYGYRMEPNQTAYSLSGKVRVNRWGFRGEDWSEPKPGGTIRVALLGDSYVFGVGVDDDETFASTLQERLNESAPPGRRYEVLNFGVSGYDTGHEIAVLEHEVLRFQPDAVVLFFFLNDVLYVKDYGFYPEMFAKQRREFSAWRWQAREWARRSRFVMGLWDAVRALSRDAMTDVMQAYVSDNQPPPAHDPEAWGFVEQRLQEFQETAKANGFVPFFTIIPTAPEIRVPLEPRAYVSYLNRAARADGINVISLADDLARGGIPLRRLLIPYDYHFSPAGHAVIAGSLQASIEARLAEDPPSDAGPLR